jgi:hypothetical protein
MNRIIKNSSLVKARELFFCIDQSRWEITYQIAMTTSRRGM